MLKFILTSRCQNNCVYCLTRNLSVIDDTDDIIAIIKLFSDLHSKGHTEIMLTGGEPTLHRQFYLIAGAAMAVFQDVHITTTNTDILRYPIGEYFTSITFSIHDSIPILPWVAVSSNVYGAVMAEHYTAHMPSHLKQFGFSGLTINENQRGCRPFTDPLPDLEHFTYKINRVGHCMNETIILPDLTIITDFKNWL